MVEQVPRVVVSLIGSSAVHRTVFLYFGNRHLIALHCCAVVCCKERERVELRCEGESCQKWRSSPMIAIMIIIIQSQPCEKDIDCSPCPQRWGLRCQILGGSWPGRSRNCRCHRVGRGNTLKDRFVQIFSYERCIWLDSRLQTTVKRKELKNLNSHSFHFRSRGFTNQSLIFVSGKFFPKR